MEPLFVYLILAVLAFVAIVALLALGIDDFDWGMDSDSPMEGGGWNGPSPFSPVFAAIFVGSYGVTGMVLELATSMSTPVVAVVAVAGGLPIYLGSYLGFRAYFGRSTGVMNDIGIVGRPAVCTVPIGPASMGEVRVLDGATERSFAAKCARTVERDESVRIASHHGSFVTVE